MCMARRVYCWGWLCGWGAELFVEWKGVNANMITSLMLMLSVDTMPRHCALLTLNIWEHGALLRTIFLKSHQFYLLINIATFIRYEGVPRSHSKRITMWRTRTTHTHTFTKRGRSPIADLLFMCFSIEPIMGVVLLCMSYTINKMHIIIYKLPENSRCGLQKKCEDSQATSHKSILCAFVDFIINFILHFWV